MFNIKSVLCLISVNFFKNEKYVLSADPDKIIFPSFDLENITNLNTIISTQITNCFIDTSISREFSVNNKFISINDEYLSNIFDTNKTLYLLYGCTVPNIDVSAGFFWKRFEFTDDSIPNELAIIGSTIERAI